MKKSVLLILLLSLIPLSETLYAQDLRTFIPADINFLLHIDGNRINSKVNFEDIRNSDMYKDFIFKTLNKKSAEERAMVKLFETPDETGMNVKSDIYWYSMKGPDDLIMTVGSVKLLNSARFTSFVKDLFSDNRKVKVGKADKKTFYLQAGSTMIVWDSEKAFYCDLPYTYQGYYGRGYKKAYLLKCIALITKPGSNNILQNNKVMLGLSTPADVTYVMNTNSLANEPDLFEHLNREEYIKDSTVFSADLFEGTYSYNRLNFENGKILLDGKQYYGHKLASILNPIFRLKVSSGLADLTYQTPVTSYISYAFSMAETRKFIERTFTYNMDTLFRDYIRSSQRDRFETDSLIMAYRKELDTINFLLNGPDALRDESNIEAITDSGTVYKQEENRYNYFNYNNSEKFEHQNLNWFQVDSLEERQDTLYDIIAARKDTLAERMVKNLNINASELWDLFKGEFIFMYHAMISVEKKYKTYEMDDEYNYVEIEKTKKIPMPLYSVAATINNDSLVRKYLKMLVDKGIIQKEGNRYLIVLGEMDQYLWIKDRNMILTNDNNFNPARRSSSSKSDYEVANYNRIIANQSSSFIEIGKIMASCANYIDDKQTGELLEIMSKYFDESVTTTNFESESNYTSDSSIIFNDSKKNSINILYEMANEIYVYFTKPK